MRKPGRRATMLAVSATGAAFRSFVSLIVASAASACSPGNTVEGSASGGNGGTVSTGGRTGQAGAAGEDGNGASNGSAGASGGGGTAGVPAGAAGSSSSGGGGRGYGGGTGGRGGSASAGAGGAVDSGAPNADGSSDPSNDKPGVFVAVGYGGRRVRSTDDGNSWVDDQSQTAKGGDDRQLLRVVAWAGRQFVALGYQALTSPDGKTWQMAALSGTTQWFGAVVFTNNVFVGAGGYGLRAISTDAASWEDHTTRGDTVPTHSGSGLIYDSDHQHFVITNDNGIRAYSPDGRNWTMSSGATGTMPTLLAAGNGVVVGAGGTSSVISRDGGVTWTGGGSLAAPAQAIVFAQGHFTIIAGSAVLTSTDGTSWTSHATSASASTIAYGHGVYVLFSDRSYRRSTDGLSWSTAKSLPDANGIEWVAFGTPG